MDIQTKEKLGLVGKGNLPRFYDDADAKSPGPWLDFLVIGFAKCGTSTLMANLAQVAPMPVRDVCEFPPQTLQRAYHEWSEKFVNASNQDTLVLRGSKCPRYIGSDAGLLKLHSQSLTKTKFIIGIR
jgi:hypothetical protein